MKKGHKLNLKEIAKENPGVDLKQVREASKILKQLEAQGVTKHSYNLSSPYDRTLSRTKGTATSSD